MHLCHLSLLKTGSVWCGCHYPKLSAAELNLFLTFLLYTFHSLPVSYLFFFLSFSSHYSCSLSALARELWMWSPAACCIADRDDEHMDLSPHIQRQLKEGKKETIQPRRPESFFLVLQQINASTAPAFSPVGWPAAPQSRQGRGFSILSCHFPSILGHPCGSFFLGGGVHGQQHTNTAVDMLSTRLSLTPLAQKPLFEPWTGHGSVLRCWWVLDRREALGSEACSSEIYCALVFRGTA